MSKFERHGKITQVTRAEDRGFYVSGICHMRGFKELTDRGATLTLPSIQKTLDTVGFGH